MKQLFFIPAVIVGLLSFPRIGYESELYALRNKREINPVECMLSREASRLFRSYQGQTLQEKELVTKSNVCNFLSWSIILLTEAGYVIRIIILRDH